MFLIRLTFWVVILLLLLPTNIDTQYSLMNIVSATYKDLRGFCERTPQTCEQGQQAVTHLKDKAVFAGQMFMNMIGKSGDNTAALENKGIDDLERQELTKRTEMRAPPIEVIEVRPYQRAAAQTQNRPNHNTQKNVQNRTYTKEHTLKDEDLKSEWSGPSVKKGS